MAVTSSGQREVAAFFEEASQGSDSGFGIQALPHHTAATFNVALAALNAIAAEHTGPLCP